MAAFLVFFLFLYNILSVACRIGSEKGSEKGNRMLPTQVGRYIYIVCRPILYNFSSLLFGITFPIIFPLLRLENLFYVFEILKHTYISHTFF